MNTSPDFARNAALLDRRAAGLLTPEEEARLRSRAASDPELRNALAVDDAIDSAFAADRASIIPPPRTLDPALLERLAATGSVASNAASTTAVSIWGRGMQIMVGLGVVAAGFFGVRAIVNTGTTNEARVPTPVVQQIDHSMLAGVATGFARTLTTLPARVASVSVTDSGSERKVKMRGAGTTEQQTHPASDDRAKTQPAKPHQEIPPEVVRADAD